jgi:hypothetical protein
MFYEGGVVLCSAMCECRQRVGLGQTRGGVLDERPGVSSKDVQGGLRQMYSGSGGAEYTAEVCTRGRGGRANLYVRLGAMVLRAGSKGAPSSSSRNAPAMVGSGVGAAASGRAGGLRGRRSEV